VRSVVVLTCGLFAINHGILAQATFHGGNDRTGTYGSPGPRQLHGVRWVFKTGGPVISSPAVTGGVLYVGSSDGGLYAIDEGTGKERWKFDTQEPISSSPAVANGVVYFLSYDGVFYALSADSGTVRWTFATGGERRFEAKGIHGLTPGDQNIPDPMDLFLSSAAVFNGRVYFGSSDGHLYALDAATGVVQWTFSTSDVVHASPAIANNTVYVGSWDGSLYAVDAETGLQRWRFQAGTDPVYHNQVGFQSSAAVRDGTVYVGCRDGHVYALDATTGKKKWDYSTSQSWVNGTPALSDSLVYVGTSDTRRFQALDAKTGRLRFVLDAEGLVFGSPALAGGIIFVGAFNGKLLAIDARTGKIIWEFRTDGSKQDPLTVLAANGTIDRGAMRPVFHNFMDMTVNLYRMFSVGAIISSPVVDQGNVYFGSADGSVYALY
jgi:eukaryotic-like serine/threonine-protein kinase